MCSDVGNINQPCNYGYLMTTVWDVFETLIFTRNQNQTSTDITNPYKVSLNPPYAERNMRTASTITINETRPIADNKSQFTIVVSVECAIHFNSIANTGTPCQSNPYKNRATCNSAGPDNYNCTCQNGFNGTQCQQDIDECASNLCQHINATCHNNIDSYSCSCPSE
ncbi:Versican core protein [Trichoplax sp. H2]|nr:Versican core protein [Trichoplax sp. H2]|eukprot:RDD44061.1 Versican core protein [Trichoplax sp. H2]